MKFISMTNNAVVKRIIRTYETNIDDFVNRKRDIKVVPSFMELMSNPYTPEYVLESIISKSWERQDVGFSSQYFNNPNASLRFIREFVTFGGIYGSEYYDGQMLMKMLVSDVIPFELKVDVLLECYSPDFSILTEGWKVDTTSYVEALKERLSKVAADDGVDVASVPLEWLVEIYAGSGSAGFQYITDDIPSF